MFKPNPLYASDAYKVGHRAMLAPGTTKLYGTWIPRSLKYLPKEITKVVSIGQQKVWREIHDMFEEHFFFTEKAKKIQEAHDSFGFNQKRQYIYELKKKALVFAKDMSLMLGTEYDGKHFEDLWELGYLPVRIKSLPEGIETGPNIPHMTFINTIDGYAWLTLFLETIVSTNAWKIPTVTSLALQFRKVATKWVKETNPEMDWLIDYMCHDFSARGLDGIDSMVNVGLGHSFVFKGSDTLMAIPASRYYYNFPEDQSPINSVNASEHSVTCTQLFYYQSKLKSGELNDRIKEYYSFDAPYEGSVENPDYLAIAEWLNLEDWLGRFPKGILSYVADTFDLWKLITFILPRLRDKIMARDGKLVIRPDSGDPVDIICGLENKPDHYLYVSGGRDFIRNNATYVSKEITSPEKKGVIELLWDAFGGTVNEQGYKVLDPHIGAIYGDSINLERQTQIYERLAAKGFAATNIVLGVGSYTYQYNTRDSAGYAAKGSWFEVANTFEDTNDSDMTGQSTPVKRSYKKAYNIYKDPITDDGTKKSLKGLVCVRDHDLVGPSEIFVQTECSPEEESQGLLQIIYENGKFHNQQTFEEIRERIKQLI